MNRMSVAMLASLAVIAGSVFWLSRSDTPTGSRSEDSADATPLVLYCAASNRAVVEAIRADYEAEFHRSVQIQYGPSQTLLSMIEVSQTGDLYLPADDSFLAMGREKQLIAEILALARMQAGVAVRRGNPKNIHTLADLLRDDVRLVQANPDASAIGKVTRNVLQRSGQWTDLDQATDVYRTTVTDVANDLVVDAADAGIVYDAVLHTYKDVEFVELPELQEAVSNIAIGVLDHSLQPTAALHFARYLAARDRGARRYAEYGFQAGVGEPWSDAVELKLFAGSMLRPAIEDTITAFENREGVRVTRVYNGCGILVAQMKAGQTPDAYFACDREFMNQVHDLFPVAQDVSQNDLVILVQKGNPYGIATLRDLAKPNLRVGIGHAKQCAMGWLTQKTFREGQVLTEVMANVTVQTPTGDMLVNQLRTGSLDAAVAYLSNATGSAEYLDAIQIEGIDCAVASQPWAVATGSQFPQTAQRLFEAICSAQSQQRFRDEGFRWTKQE